MKIIFATKNYHVLLSQIIQYVEEQESLQEGIIAFNDFIPGIRKVVDSVDQQTLIETDVREQDVYLLSGNGNDEFLEMYDMVSYFLNNNASRINVIFPLPLWSESNMEDRKSFPLKNRINILSSLLKINKSIPINFFFINPRSSFDLKKHDQIRHNILYTNDLLKDFVPEFGEKFVFYNISNKAPFEMVEKYSNDNNIKIIKEKNLKKAKDKNVVLFSCFLEDSSPNDWNLWASKLKEFGANKVFAFIPHCKSVEEKVFDKELFEQVIITDSHPTSVFNTFGESIFHMKSIAPFIYEEIINVR